MYGHTLGHGNMSQHNNQWMEHLNNEHEEGDEHFGYFDLLQQSLHCTFQIGDENYRFQGIKNQ